MKDISCCRYYSRSVQYCLPLVILAPVAGAGTVQAQTVVPANDGTGTVVTQEGNQSNITAGSVSADGVNLFHSFETFSVETGTVANFVADPAVQNVVARVAGSEPSVINGEVQISSLGQPDLFLMNPAGVLIGPGAILNLPGNLTVTTADAIGFEQADFSATGKNLYTALTGEPTGDFVFARSQPENGQPGSIVNQGTLIVPENSAVTMVGGSVINTGSIIAPSGSITIAAVAGESRVRIQQAGSLLSLEIDSLANNNTPAVGSSNEMFLSPEISPLALPQLLTYGDQSHANTFTVNNDGSVSLGFSEAADVNGAISHLPNCFVPGCALISGKLTVEGNSVAIGNGLGNSGREGIGLGHTIGGDINILGEQVALHGAELSASGPSGGGTIRIGGEARGASILPAARTTLVTEQTQMAADGLFVGDGGRVTVWADDTTQYLGEISATGGRLGGDGGFVEVSGKRALAFRGSVDTGSANGTVGTLLLDPENITIINAQFASEDGELADRQVLAGDGGGLFTLSVTALENLLNSSTVILEATNNITLENLPHNTLSFDPHPSGGSLTLRADANGDGAGNVIFNDLNDRIVAPGRSLTISGANLLLGDLNTTATNSGDITLQASGNITVGNLETFSTTGSGGNVNLAAEDDITVQVIRTGSPIQAGTIAATSQTGDIAVTNILNSTANTPNTNINFSAPGDISIAEQSLPDFLAGLMSAEPESEPPPPVSPFDSLVAQLATLAAGEDSSSNSDSNSNATSRGAANIPQRTELSARDATEALADLDGESNQDFSDYFGRELTTTELSLAEVQQLLTTVERESGNRSAVVYVTAPATETVDEASSAQRSDADASSEADSAGSALELLLFTAEGAPVKFTLPEVERSVLLETIEQFRTDLTTSIRRGGNYYLEPARQLYDWLIGSLEDELGPAGIDTLVFSMGEGLRAVPMAALHDGEQFLVEKYSLGVVPSLGMLEAAYTSLDDAQVLAMGASTFRELPPLPGVPLEIEAIDSLWPAEPFLNEQFTRQTLIAQRQQVPYKVVHLATHAEFNSGSIDNSYIQLWDEKLLLSEINQLGWRSPAVDLLVLSACRTAVGSPEAEMGFAGLAIASGVSSAMASLWAVNDLGTLALMNEFYAQLRNSPTKAQALQNTQLAMLQGRVRSENGQLMVTNLDSSLPLPPELSSSATVDFSHPYYWSGFTMIGSPW